MPIIAVLKKGRDTPLVVEFQGFALTVNGQPNGNFCSMVSKSGNLLLIPLATSTRRFERSRRKHKRNRCWQEREWGFTVATPPM